MSLPATVINTLKEISGNSSVLTDPVQLIGYENDGLGFHRHQPDAVVIPNGSEELIKIVNLIKDEDIPYVLRGGGTSLSGGPTPLQGGLVIHVSKMNNILEIHPEDFYCVVEPGVILNRLDETLKEQGLFYPPDPSSGFAATIGGNVAENAGGLQCFKYGVTANYILGLEVITTTGDVLQLGGPAGGLGNGGMDWRALMVGSEGMLATITKVWLRLKPRNEKVWTFMASYANLKDATSAIYDCATSIITPVALEFIDHKVVDLVENSPMAVGLDKGCCVVLTEIDGPAELVDQQVNFVQAQLEKHQPLRCEKTDDPEQRKKLWISRKVAGGLMGQISPDLMIQDAVIPRHELQNILDMLYRECDERGIEVLNVFHAGDGNLHPNFLFSSRDPESYDKVKAMGSLLMERVIEVGGSLSGEHGIGCDKSRYLPKAMNEDEIALQRAILKVFNPHDQLNPEKMIPMRSFVGCCAPRKSS